MYMMRINSDIRNTLISPEEIKGQNPALLHHMYIGCLS